MFTQIVRLSFVDLRWAQLYVSLVFDKVADAECCFPFFAKFSTLVVCHRSITDSLFLDIGIENKLSAESSVLWKKRSEHFTRFTFLYKWGIMLIQKRWEILFIISRSCSILYVDSSDEVFDSSYPPSDGICIPFSPFVLWIWCFCLARV